jgi:fructose-1,6-bisphosphatase II
VTDSPDLRLPDRNLALELVRVTEAAALAAAHWMGTGDKIGADGAAVDAMRHVLQSVDMDGVVVIGEGEKDEAPMLFNGERIGNGMPPATDIAVDPIDGTTLLSLGRPNAIAVVALSPQGTMYNPGPCVYMEKIAVGREAAGTVDIEAPVADNLAAVAKAKGVAVADLVVIILDRPRHDDLVAEVRATGARIKSISDGDIAGAIMTCVEDAPGDVLLGIGGTPEGVTTACALKCFGGEIQGKLWPRDDVERSAAIDAGLDLDQVLGIDDLVRGDNVFFAATGVTDGELLDGVRYRGAGATTHSLVMRGQSGTIRWVKATHDRDKLRQISDIAY